MQRVGEAQQEETTNGSAARFCNKSATGGESMNWCWCHVSRPCWAALGRRQRRHHLQARSQRLALHRDRVSPCTMTDGPQDGAAPAAAAQDGGVEQQQQQQQVAAQVEQLTYSLQDLLKKPEAE